MIRRQIIILAAVGWLLAGCGGQSLTPSQPAALPPATTTPGATTPSTPADHLDLTPVSFDTLPGWTSDDVSAALPALARSCAKIEDSPPRQPIGREGTGGVVADWLGPCGALREVPAGNAAAARTYFTAWFQPYRATAPGVRGQLTGYYEPDIAGALKPDAQHKVPLYARPRDLVQVPLGPFDPTLAGRDVWGRIVNGRLAPYPTRAEIEAGALANVATPLAWAADPVDAQILEIQGSGRVHLPDGKVVRLGFDGTNGRPFLGLSRILIDAGKLPVNQADMPSVRDWLETHPADRQALLDKNPRSTFFRIIQGDGPVGAQGVALTPGRSLAVDNRFVPYGVPVWLDSRRPDGKALQRVMVAQDAGAAIKGALRGDVFWGAGAEAFQLAGRMNSPGDWYLLLPRHRSGEFALLESPTMKAGQ